MIERDVTFEAMGCEVRLIVEGPGADEAIVSARAFVEDFDSRLSRFRAGSELCALNADPREAVPASPLLRAAVRGGLWAAERSGGLVTPVVIDALEAAGYRRSLARAEPASLAQALAAAPPRCPARPDPAQPWRQVSVDDARRQISRPPGLRLDTGGTGKGLAADALVARLGGLDRVVVDCGGDVRVAGARSADRPVEVQVVHPLTGQPADAVTLPRGAVATSGIDVRVWRRRDGSYAHHLIDPCTGQPAWTGLVGVTALAETALEAETLSKAALLSGAVRARSILRRRGGLLVNEDGVVETVGPVHRQRRVVRMRAAA